MQISRRIWLPVALIGTVTVCAWCSVISGVGGWVMGRDIALREAQVAFEATAVANGPALPDLGVLVTRLDRSGPAARAGIARGDTIVALDADPLDNARDLHDALGRYRVGETVRVKVVRERDSIDVAVQLAAFPGGSPDQPYLGIYYTARDDEPADL
jgi:S1-C subfamily serine protease